MRYQLLSIACRIVALFGLTVAATLTASAQARSSAATPRNVILILSDDHRYDFMGFMERAPRWLDWQAADRKSP